MNDPNRARGGCRPFGRLRRVLAGAGSDEAEAALGVAEPSDASDVSSPAVLQREFGNVRTPEVVGRIWVAPYVDEEGLYHEAGWVWTVLEPARWRLP